MSSCPSSRLHNKPSQTLWCKIATILLCRFCGSESQRGNSRDTSTSWCPGLQLEVLKQGSPTPQPCASTSPWPVRNQAAQQEVNSGWVSKASSVFTAAPYCPHRPSRWNNCLLQNWSLVPKRLGTSALYSLQSSSSRMGSCLLYSSVETSRQFLCVFLVVITLFLFRLYSLT